MTPHLNTYSLSLSVSLSLSLSHTHTHSHTLEGNSKIRWDVPSECLLRILEMNVLTSGMLSDHSAASCDRQPLDSCSFNQHPPCVPVDTVS